MDNIDLWVALEEAVKNKKPILLFNWTPNWVEHKFKGEFVNFPDYDPKCETDPAWGVSKEWKFDCGNPKNGWLKKAVSKKLKTKSPCAFEVVKNFNFENLQIAEVAFSVNSRGLTAKAAAKDWVKNNKTIWKKWIPLNCSGGTH